MAWHSVFCGKNAQSASDRRRFTKCLRNTCFNVYGFSAFRGVSDRAPAIRGQSRRFPHETHYPTTALQGLSNARVATRPRLAKKSILSDAIILTILAIGKVRDGRAGTAGPLNPRKRSKLVLLLPVAPQAFFSNFLSLSGTQTTSGGLVAARHESCAGPAIESSRHDEGARARSRYGPLIG
jgi:hypothetical protein